MNSVRERAPTAFEVLPEIVEQINAIAPGSTELDNEGRARELFEGQSTMRAANLCPDQGMRAALGFRASFGG